MKGGERDVGRDWRKKSRVRSRDGHGKVIPKHDSPESTICHDFFGLHTEYLLYHANDSLKYQNSTPYKRIFFLKKLLGSTQNEGIDRIVRDNVEGNEWLGNDTYFHSYKEGMTQAIFL